MALNVTKRDVWAGEIRDEPSGLAKALAAIAGAGGNLECVIARRQAENPGTGVVFVTRISGKKAANAARDAGFNEAAHVPTLRVEGDDRPGLGARIAGAVGDAGVSMRGLTAAVMGRRFVAYLGFDSAEDAAKAATAIRALGRKG